MVTLSNLGEIHCQRGEWDDTTKMYEDFFDALREKPEGWDHVDVALIGLVYDQRGDVCLVLYYF